METKFDPYRKWLGIAPKDQPPHHYRLLGIDLFEEDADVIGNAADQRMAHLRTFQTGRYVQLSQQILGEVSAAKLTLLNRDKKRAYDAALRQALAVSPPPPPPVEPQRLPPRPGAITAPPPAEVAPSKQGPVATHSPVLTRPQSPSQSAAAGSPVVDVARATPSVARRVRRQRNNATPVMVSIGLVILIGLIAIVAIAMQDDTEQASPSEPPPRYRPVGERSREPRLTLKFARVPPQSARVGQLFEVALPSTGNANGKAELILVAGPPGAELDTDGGRLRWRPEARHANSLQRVKIRAQTRDKRRTLDEVAFEIRVEASSDGPTIEPIGPQTVPVDGQLTFQVRAAGDGLQYSLEDAPPGARIDAEGNFFWRPLSIAVGTEFAVVIEVRDAGGGRETIRFPVTVVEDEARRVQRRIAEAVWKLGGELVLSDSDAVRTAADTLPEAPFEIVAITIHSDEVTNPHLQIVGRLPSLRRLDVASAQITDEGLSGWPASSAIEELSLRAPQVTDAGVAHLGALRSLRRLTIHGPIQGQAFEAFAGHEHLAELTLKETNIDDAGLRPLIGLPALSKLFVQSGRLTNRAFITISRISPLTALVLVGDRITGDDVNELRVLNGLQHLKLASSGLRDEHLRGLRVLQLQTLELDGPIGGKGLENLAGLTVPSLTIISQNLDEADLTALGKLPNLRELRLDTAEIGNAGCMALMQCGGLVALEVCNAGGVTRQGVAILVRLPNLTRLTLTGAQLKEEEILEIRKGSSIALSIE